MYSSIYLPEKPDELCSFVETKLKNHKHKTYKYANVPYREAAILLLLFYKNDTIHLLFTKRTEKVEHHKGQISFPGGMKDKSDKDLKITALRETWEEMGIAEENITILGRIDNFLTNTNFLITPYVGYFPFPYNYKINEDEISKVIEVPLPELLKSERFEIKKWYRNGILWDIHYYYFNNETIWGVTGFLLSNFLSIVFGLKKELFDY